MNSNSCKERLGEVCIGGYARAMTMVKKLKAERAEQNKNPIFLNIGDNFQGTLWYELFGWNVTSHFLNILPADATTLGNHEFDRGVKEVVNFLEHLKSPVLVANLDDSDEPEIQGLYKKSMVIERSGRKIGVIGALLVATEEISSPENLHILNEIDSTRDEAARLRSEGVDIIVVLSHCGIDIDQQMAQTGGENIDVIVGGHSHSLYYSGEPAPGPDTPVDVYPAVYKHESGHNILVVQASSYAKYVGDLVVYFDREGEAQSWEGNTIFLDNSVEPDADIIRELQPWKAKVDEVGQRDVGTVNETLDWTDCEFAECNIGNFIADAYADYFLSNSGQRRQKRTVLRKPSSINTIAAMHAGGIRTDLSAGKVNYDDLFTVIPFMFGVDSFDLRGDHLLEALEYSGANYRDYNFLQFSGMKVVFNVTRPKFNRVVSVDVLNRQCKSLRYEKLNRAQWYRFIVPDFIGAGGNGFTVFKKNRRNVRKADKKDIEIVERYIKKQQPVIQRKDGRLTVVT